MVQIHWRKMQFHFAISQLFNFETERRKNYFQGFFFLLLCAHITKKNVYKNKEKVKEDDK